MSQSWSIALDNRAKWNTACVKIYRDVLFASLSFHTNVTLSWLNLPVVMLDVCVNEFPKSSRVKQIRHDCCFLRILLQKFSSPAESISHSWYDRTPLCQRFLSCFQSSLLTNVITFKLFIFRFCASSRTSPLWMPGFPASDSMCLLEKRGVFLCVLCTVELCACSLTYLCKFAPEPFSESDLHPW